jgi:DNA polymerase I-like protein with 3'-5' exonuclease and polymerase domains
MAIARVSLSNRLKGKEDVKLINTVHDSIIIDFDSSKNDPLELVTLVDNCFNDVPLNFKKLFGVEFNLPMRVSCEVGKDWGTMEEIKCK